MAFPYGFFLIFFRVLQIVHSPPRHWNRFGPWRWSWTRSRCRRATFLFWEGRSSIKVMHFDIINSQLLWAHFVVPSHSALVHFGPSLTRPTHTWGSLLAAERQKPIGKCKSNKFNVQNQWDLMVAINSEKAWEKFWEISTTTKETL